MDIGNDMLRHDLLSESHDSTYRAMSYIERNGGPSIIGPVDNVVALRANRAPMLSWLTEQNDPERMAREYEEFRQQWNPIFKN